MRLPSDMLFVPRWLGNIQPVNPVMMCVSESPYQVYPPSCLTAKTVNSTTCEAVTGTIVKDEQQQIIAEFDRRRADAFAAFAEEDA